MARKDIRGKIGTQAVFFSFFLGAFPSGSRRHWPPHRRCARTLRVTVPHKELELVRIECTGGVPAGSGPPAKPALGQALVAKPHPLAVVHKDAQRRAPAIAEDERRATEWIGLHASRHKHARPSMPRRKSTGSTARRILI